MDDFKKTNEIPEIKHVHFLTILVLQGEINQNVPEFVKKQAFVYTKFVGY